MSDQVIEAVALRKEYGPKIAVQDLDLVVERGESFGFLGPNGAGKTTFIKMLLGLVRPTSGEARILGLPVSDPAARQRVGFLPEHFSFHDFISAEELLDLHGRLLHLGREVRRQQAAALLEMVGLGDACHRPLSTFSKGMLQRVGLAQALLGQPELVFLDEPTSGLDPLGRVLVRDIIRDLRAHGTTVFLNSHLLTEVELTCTRVAFIVGGGVRESRSLDAERDGPVTVDISLGGLDQRLPEGLRAWSSQVEIHDAEGTLTLYGVKREALPQIARWLVGQGAAIYAFTPRHQSLEELYLQYVKETD